MVEELDGEGTNDTSRYVVEELDGEDTNDTSRYVVEKLGHK